MKILLIGLALTGVISGFLAGLLGIGGGIVIIPSLFFLFHIFPIKYNNFISQIIFASSNGIIFLTSLRNFYNYYKNNLISLKTTLKLALICIIGGFIGGKLAGLFSSNTLKIIFGFFLFFISIRMFFSKKLEAKENFSKESIKLNNLTLITIGLIVGIISGFFGIGGGIIVVPLLNIFFKIPILYAQGFSVSLIPFNSFGGVAGYIFNGIKHIGIDFPYIGFVNIYVVIICGILSIISTKAGLTVAKNINKILLKRIFAILLMFVSIKFIFT